MDKLTRVWKSGDVFGQAGFPLFPQQYNLMVDIVSIPEVADHKVLEVKMLIPQYASSTDLAQGIKPTQGVHEFGDRLFTVLWNNQKYTPKTGPCFLFGVTEQFPKQEADWEFGEDAAYLPTYENVHAELSLGSARPLKMLELFCGGFGGWSSGLNFVSKFLAFPVRCVGIDSCWDAVTQYAVTHTANIINGYHDFPVTLLDNHQHSVIWADIDSEQFFGFPPWIEQMMQWSPDYLCFSSPCPPWSSAGRLSGLSTNEGILFAKALSICRMLRPRLIGIEQVGGFPSHPESKLLVDLLRSSGYQIIWQGVIDAGQFGASNRPRWLCLACLQYCDDLEPTIHQEWVKRHGTTPISMNTILQWDMHEFQELVVPEQVLEMASSFEFLPNSGKFRLFNNRQAVLKSRCNDGTSQNRTFMAMYGSQHEIDVRHLKEKGLLVHFACLVPENNVIRYWHPLEIMLQHVTTHRLFAPKPLKVGWRIAGNMLSQPHATFIHVNGLNLLKASDPKMKMTTVFGELWASKLNAGNTVKDLLPNGAFLSHVFDEDMVNLKDNFVALIDFSDAFPTNSFWDSQSGFQPLPTNLIAVDVPAAVTQDASVVSQASTTAIPATVPFCVLQKGHIVQPGGIFSFMAAMDLPKTDIENLWLDRFVCEFVSTDEANDIGCSIRMTPRIAFADDAIPGNVVVIAINGEMTILPFPEDRNMVQLLAAHHVEGDFEDQFGPPLMTAYGKAPLFTPVCAPVTRDLPSPAFDGQHVKIKLRSCVLWEGYVASDVTLQHLIGILKPSIVAYAPADPRVLCRGKTLWHYPTTLAEVAQEQGCSSLTLHIIHSLHGGGAKEINRQQAKNSLASTLLENGFELKWVSSTAETLISRASQAEVSKAAQLTTSSERMKAILKLCKDCGIETNVAEKKSIHVQNKAHATKAKRMSQVQLNPSEYLLEAGFLKNQDKTEVPQIQQISARSTGVCFATAEQAIPWLREGCTLSKDELGLFILGPQMPCSTKLSHQQVTIPCRNHQNAQVILTGHLVQLGEKAICVTSPATPTVTVTKSQVVALTMWKDNWSEQDWDQILKNTNAFLRNALGDYGSYDSITSIWGKSFRKKNKAVNPHEAESVQVHCSVLDTNLSALLSASGFNFIYATPKNAEGRIDDDQWRVIWVEGLLREDPWAPYFSRQADAASLPSRAPPAAPRAVSGPTEQKFQHQDSRLAALETGLQELRQVQQEQAASQQAFQNATQSAFKATEEGLKSYVASAIDQVKKDLDSSWHQAMENQTKQINANLADLKALFQARPKRTRGKAEGEDDEMESDS
eukprot:Skav216835  [mRNA]  locus=scaffold1340:167019:171677:+ [translate_table: standard]